MEIEVGKLYLLWNGELCECVEVVDDGKKAQFRNILKRRTPGTYDDMVYIVGRKTIDQMVLREATGEDIRNVIKGEEIGINQLYDKIDERNNNVYILGEWMNRD